MKNLDLKKSHSNRFIFKINSQIYKQKIQIVYRKIKNVTYLEFANISYITLPIFCYKYITLKNLKLTLHCQYK